LLLLKGYLKQYHTYQTFNSKDLLLLLNCSTPEMAQKEAEYQLNNILKVKQLDDKVKDFVTDLLIDGMKFLKDCDAELYWMEKKSMTATILNSHKQLQLFHKVSSDLMDNILSSVQRPDQPDISTNTPSSPASLAETEPTNENVWSIWSDTLHTMQTEDNNGQDVHEYRYDKFLPFYPPLFESLAVSLDECHTMLLRNILKVKKAADPALQFTFDFFMVL
ncbi:hypothetical protein INT47_004151, partial [Mucor saturninus]